MNNPDDKSNYGIAKSIPTNWKGYHFRSRTEARWAVFFDAIGIHFQYEPEGFVLSTGARYLPDFLLPTVRLWAEVKPLEQTLIESEKAHHLVAESGMGMLWLIGPPDFRGYIAQTPDCGDLTFCEYSLDIYAHAREYYDIEHRFFSCPNEITESSCSPQYQEAVYASRGARFGA